jgi:phage baseplate assembly protein W
MTEADDKSFLGQGWSFPAELNKTGDIALAADVEDIQQAIMIILGTAQGERLMRPDFGAGLQALVFEPINTTTMALVRHRVEEALISWEPRIDRITVQVTADPPQGRLMIEIRYRVRTTNTFYNLVYPFYLLEDKRT